MTLDLTPSGSISSRTRRKSKLHRSTNLTPGGDGYDESDNAETGVPPDNEVDDAISGDVIVVCDPGRRSEEGRETTAERRNHRMARNSTELFPFMHNG